MITHIGTHRALAGAIAGVALLVAGCGSSASTSSHTTSGSGAAAPATATALTLATASNGDGTYLTADGGRALYLWDGDHGAASSCSGGCASAWPPLTTSGTPAASGSVKTSELGTITRQGGGKQVTYDGHPLYYFAGDSGAGTTNGQGSDEFGAHWWLVAPSGAAISKTASSSATSGSASGYSSYSPGSTSGSSSSSSSGSSGGW